MPSLKFRLTIAALGSSIALTGCISGGATDADLPTGDAAYQTIAPDSIPAPTEYLIATGDIFNLQVFGEPEINNEALRVDQAGNVQVALVGPIKAEGRSATEVGDDIADRLRKSYIIDPKVNLSLVEPAKRYVSIEGDVNKPGVYEIDNGFTLLSALARAESTAPTAKLDQVIIFRTIKGQRMAARFNLKDIRGGAAPDPTIMSNDVVMVGYSSSKGIWQDFLKMAPLINVFTLATTRY